MNSGKGRCGCTHTHEAVSEEKPGKLDRGFLGNQFDGGLSLVGKIIEAPFKLQKSVRRCLSVWLSQWVKAYIPCQPV